MQKKCKSYKSHQELSKSLLDRDPYSQYLVTIEYLLAKIGFATAENGPLKVCEKLAKSWKKVEVNIGKRRACGRREAARASRAVLERPGLEVPSVDDCNTDADRVRNEIT